MIGMQDLLKGSRQLYLEYTVVALVIMLPLLLPGYILTLDMVFTPHLRMPTENSNLYLSAALLHILNLVIPSQIIQKLILLGALVSSSVGAHRITLWLKPKISWGAYYAGILYMINPFTYSRLMAGQYLIVLGYAAMPFFTLALWRFLTSPNIKRSFIVAAWAVVISILAINSIFFMLLVGLVSAAVFWRRYHRQWLRVMWLGIVVILVWVIASSYWLVPMLQGSSPEAQVITRFDNQYVVGFQTDADKHFGVIFNAASMYGFWEDREHRYTLPKSIVPLWPALSVAIMGLAVIGSIVGWRSGRRAEVAAMALLGIISLVLGIGIAYKPLVPLYVWMVRYIPLYRGYREPQKFIGLLVLSYAFLGSLGVNFIIGMVSKLRGKVLATAAGIICPVAILLLPIIYTPTMLWGFAGQLHPVDYPSDWYALNTNLDHDNTDFKVLFFPWHQYLSFPFTKTVISNPANTFFDKPVIQGDNIEFGVIFHQESTPETIYVENQILRPHFEITDAGSRLKPLKVKYIVVAKNEDFHLYDFLHQQTDLTLISNSKNLLVYRNNAFQLGGQR